MSFDITSKEFWEPGETRKELRRVFDTCYGCTLCHTLCPSFVSLFQMMDENFGEAVRGRTNSRPSRAAAWGRAKAACAARSCRN